MLFDGMVTGFALHEIICDEQGQPIDYRFLAVNPAFEQMTSLKAENIVGKTVLEVMPNIEQQWINTFGKVALTGEPTFFENYSAEIDKHFAVTVYQPNSKQFSCIFTDITERKRARDERTKLNADLQALMERATASDEKTPK